jgi:membrane-bound inhibitor of C-type lysozyme
MKNSSSHSLQLFFKATIALLAAGLMTSAAANDISNSTSTAKKTVKAKPVKVAKASNKSAEIDASEPEPNIEQSSDTEYKCELGNSLVMYAHPEDNKSLAMRWKNRLYKLTRVETSTGAHRFENEKIGLVWINIPSKGMLLDSRRGHQLANECKSTKIASLETTDTVVK